MNRYTGSAISTGCEHFEVRMFPKPMVHDLEEIDLQVKVADDYSGYLETIVKLHFSEAAVSTLYLQLSTTRQFILL